MADKEKAATDPAAVSLDDKYDLSKERIFVTGTQALVRLAMMQSERDRRAGLDTGGYVTGYRGSPLGQVDMQFARAKGVLAPRNIIFQPGINEDLAATAIWGTQQAELRGEGKHDGVFAMWYGKGPGVDRSGDVLRHANMAGSSKNGGVLVLMGDDHISESSTTAHQSDFAMVDAMIPFLYPSGVQEIVDYGLYGFAMSRFTGCWIGMKLMKDTVDTTASIAVDDARVAPVFPEVAVPPGGLNIRAFEWPLEAEARMHDFKQPAVQAFLKANGLNRVILKGGRKRRLGILTAGKSFLDVRQALDDLGIDEKKAADLGLALMKIAAPWPLVPDEIAAFAEGLDTLMVVEEKRGLMESQARDLLYGRTRMPRIIGKKDEEGRDLFPAKGQLDTNLIALAIAERILAVSDDAGVKTRAAEIRKAQGQVGRIAQLATRTPYFCSGCPHNTSTRIPEGSRGYAGIGCHWMVQLIPERETMGFTHMGGEGANWIGESLFSKTGHVFQNIGDGTYNHSGYLAIRAAIASGATMTYKILYNDAVAMTGGQKNDGGLTVNEVVAQVVAEGASRVDVVTDEPEKFHGGSFPSGVAIHHRDDLDDVQRVLRETKGVSVLVYDQTCASEKRRRRKRGQFPDPDRRVFINDLVCEGCGDCGVQSNCVAVAPLETEFGRKRQIDQSACNKDFSCLKGFCPSFVTVEGAKVRKGKGAGARKGAVTDLPPLPEPAIPAFDKQYAMVVTGIGGTGVVTIGALVGMAAHLEGMGCGVLDMQGLAQKGGAVVSHIRIARTPGDIATIRVPAGGADVVLGCDLIVAGTEKTLATMAPGKTYVVGNTHKQMTGDFTKNPDFDLPTERIRRQIAERVGEGNADFVAATKLAVALMGDSIAANLFMLGFAVQKGRVPITPAAIEKAIELNGVAVAMNKAAFTWGRRAAHDPAAVQAIALPEQAPAPVETLDALIKRREAYLHDYQDRDYANQYWQLVDDVRTRERQLDLGERLTDAVARNLFKLMAIKDEYEVARLYTDGSFRKKLAETFEGDFRVKFHLAPPLIAQKGSDGKLRKREYGPWMETAFRLLAKMRSFRGSTLDVFGMTAERKMERRILADYRSRIAAILKDLAAENHAIAIEIARVPESIRGFGHVKEANVAKAEKQVETLMTRFRTPPAAAKQAAE